MGYKKKFLWYLLLLTLGGCNTGVKHSLNPFHYLLGRRSSPPTNVYRPLDARSNTKLLGQWVFSPDGYGNVVYASNFLPGSFVAARMIAANAKEAYRAAADSVKRANVGRTKADIACACVMRGDGVPVTPLAYSWAAYIVAYASANFAHAVSNLSFAAEYAYASAAASAHAAIAASDRAAAIACSAMHAVNSNMRSAAASAASTAYAAATAAGGGFCAAADYRFDAADYASYAAHTIETIDCIRRASGSSNASSAAFYDLAACTVSAHAASSSNTASAAAVYAHVAHAASSTAFACCAYADTVLNVICARLAYDRVIKDCETPMLRKIVNYLRKISSVNIHTDIACAAVSRACAAVTRGRSAAADAADAAASAVDAVVAVTVDDAAVAAARAAVDFASAAASAAANAAALVSTVRLPAARAATAVDIM